jgi:hypothetical protein
LLSCSLSRSLSVSLSSSLLQCLYLSFTTVYLSLSLSFCSAFARPGGRGALIFSSNLFNPRYPNFEWCGMSCILRNMLVRFRLRACVRARVLVRCCVFSLLASCMCVRVRLCMWWRVVVFRRSAVATTPRRAASEWVPTVSRGFFFWFRRCHFAQRIIDLGSSSDGVWHLLLLLAPASSTARL